MSESTPFDAARQARRVTEQAVTWYIENQEPLSERQRLAFLAWLRASPLHVAEYFAIVRMHGDMKAAAALEKLTATELVDNAVRENPVVLFPLVGNVMPPQHAPVARGARTRRALAGMLAAVAAVAVVWLGVTQWRPLHAPADLRFAQSYSDDTNTVHSLKLVDGTLVQLDRNSAIDVHFDEHYRRIEVVRGHALFDVGKDAARPMLVNVGGHMLQDIGTVFDVRRDASGDTLTVISGRVRVLNVPKASTKTWDPASLGSPAVADLTAGQQIQLDTASASDVRPAQIAQTTAWLPAEIRFQHETIGDVARRFNAYTSKPLVIENEHLADQRISGVFHANNPQAFVAYLSTLPDVRIIDDADRIRVVAALHQTETKSGHL
ncbi:FecR domain-containing protein [Dyella sp. 2HG41-7]|uniref:FecR family protein n=1 Tax=Dyella sp. 2HG41-7 TaxID=2883239 RepID=UPI001F237ED8|nr:FecR domain-containing protein [Dyella sp. 2HG41-7]